MAKRSPYNMRSRKPRQVKKKIQKNFSLWHKWIK